MRARATQQSTMAATGTRKLHFGIKYGMWLTRATAAPTTTTRAYTAATPKPANACKDSGRYGSDGGAGMAPDSSPVAPPCSGQAVTCGSPVPAAAPPDGT